MSRTSIYEARNNLSSLIKEAESGRPVELTRHEKPVAVILGYGEYEKKILQGDWFVELRQMVKDGAIVSKEGKQDEGLPFMRSREVPKPILFSLGNEG